MSVWTWSSGKFSYSTLLFSGESRVVHSWQSCRTEAFCWLIISWQTVAFDPQRTLGVKGTNSMCKSSKIWGLFIVSTYFNPSLIETTWDHWIFLVGWENNHSVVWELWHDFCCCILLQTGWAHSWIEISWPKGRSKKAGVVVWIPVSPMNICIKIWSLIPFLTTGATWESE